MLQEYFNNTIEQSFLKALLSAVQLPNYKIVCDTDYLFEGYFYIYNEKIIKCTKSGVIKPNNFILGSSYIGSQLSQDQAEFDEIDHYRFNCMDQNIEFKEFIRASYYSTELHKRLGEYLRCLRDFKNINLMGMYNCFSYELFSDIHCDWYDDSYKILYGTDHSKKLLAVPIKFNTEYTVAIQSSQPMIVFPVFKFPNGKKFFKSSTENITVIHGSKFENPFKISVDLQETDGEWYEYEKYLYLVIQVNSTNNSSFVVLEGDYSSNGIMLVSPQAEQQGKAVDLMYRPKLLQFNSGTSYAYSDTLIQYLLRNVITNIDTVSGNTSYSYSDDEEEIKFAGNIAYAKKLVNFTDRINYWDNNVKYSAYMKYLTKDALTTSTNGYKEQNLKKITKTCEDVTGFIDKQIEEYLNYAVCDSNISTNN